MTINMGEVDVGCGSPGRSFPGNAPPNQEAVSPGEAGACDPQLWSALSSLVQNRPQSVASGPAPTGLPQQKQLDKAQESLNSQTKEQNSLTALSQKVLPVHSRPPASKVSGHTHGFSTHPPTHHLPILRAWAWGVSNASKASAQLAE